MITRNKHEQRSLEAILATTPAERARKNAAIVALLDSFLQGDEQEQRETGAFLRKALDEDRPSYRKFYSQ